MYVFKNILGSFGIDKSGNLLGKVSKGKELPPEKLHSALLLMRARHDELRRKNFTITKKAIVESVQPDSLVLQSASLIEELDKAINTLNKRLSEWYAHFDPETSYKVKDPDNLCRKVIKGDIKSSMGASISAKDKAELNSIAKQVLSLVDLREKQEKYLQDTLKKYYPNLFSVAGAAISAKLMREAGGIKRMAVIPATRLQVLGAERAMFRHMRNKKARPPKYGVLSQHKYFSQLKKKVHGKMARYLADKISLACKIDYFKGKYMGDKLKRDVEKRFRLLGEKK